MLDGVEAEFVGAAVDGAAFDAAAGHPDAEAVRMMIAPVAALRAWRATELGGEENERVVEHASLLEVFEKARDRLVHLLCEHGVTLLQTGMRIPRACCTIAMLELDEAHTAFSESTSDDELSSEGLGHFVIKAVELLGLVALRVEIHRLGNSGLHVEGELVALHARGERFVAGILLGVERVELVDEVKLRRLLGFANGDLGRGKGERILRIDLQIHRVVSRAEVVTVANIKVTRPHVDEGRQIVRHRAKTIRHPRAKRRHTRLQHVAAAVELHLRTVVVVRRPHAADEGDLVRTGADVREPVADFDAALAIAFAADLKRVNDVALLAVRIVHNDHTHLFELLGVLHAGKGRLADRLARILREHRLRIEALHVTDAAAHEQPDHTLGLLRHHRQPARRLPAFLRFQHGRDRDAAETAEDVAAEEGCGLMHEVHRRVTKSL